MTDPCCPKDSTIMGNQDLASGGTKTIEDILIPMQSLATKEDLKGLTTKVKGLTTKVEGLTTKVECLIAATPAAADIPNVYIAGKNWKLVNVDVG
jgi:hypothetical protein